MYFPLWQLFPVYSAGNWQACVTFLACMVKSSVLRANLWICESSGNLFERGHCGMPLGNSNFRSAIDVPFVWLKKQFESR